MHMKGSPPCDHAHDIDNEEKKDQQPDDRKNPSETPHRTIHGPQFPPLPLFQEDTVHFLRLTKDWSKSSAIRNHHRYWAPPGLHSRNCKTIAMRFSHSKNLSVSCRVTFVSAQLSAIILYVIRIELTGASVKKSLDINPGRLCTLGASNVFAPRP